MAATDEEILEKYRPVNERLMEQGTLGEAIVVGRPFAEVEESTDWKTYLEFRLAPEVNELLAASTEETVDWYTGESPFGGPIAHPVALIKLAGKALHTPFAVTVPDGQSNFHARIEVEFLRPARVDALYRLEGRLAEKYVRRGRRYLVYEGRFIDESGDTVLKYRQWRTVGKEEVDQSGE
jgi:acyl dehydratase